MSTLVDSARARLRKSLTKGVLAPVGALYDVSRAGNREFLSKPFNGQSGRRAIVDDVLRRLDCEVIVETGTFHGGSTDYFTRKHPGLVISVEATPRYFWYARMRLLGLRNLRLVHSDSRAALRELARDADVAQKRVVFYLDAHWEEDLPLAEEVQIIAESFRHWAAIVDDFAVPDDPGYAFDAYGPDKTLDLAYVERLRLKGMQCFWPRRRSADEDGMKRGCVVLTTVPSVAEALRESAELRQIGTNGT